MEIAAKLNNHGAVLLASDECDKACQYFEEALRVLLDTCRVGRNRSASTSLHTSMLSTSTACHRALHKSHESNKDEIPRHGPQAPSDMIHFFALHEEEEECLRELSVVCNDVQDNLYLETDPTCISDHLESCAVAINVRAVSEQVKARQNRGGTQEAEDDGSILPLLTILSSTVLLNMALAIHMSGLSRNDAATLERASQLYEKVRFLISSLFMGEGNEPTHLFPTLEIINVLYMTSLNNAGYLALQMARSELSYQCFDSLYVFSSLFLTRHPQKSCPTGSHEVATSLPHRNTHDDTHFSIQEAPTIDPILRRKANFFFLNAMCQQRPCSAPIA